MPNYEWIQPNSSSSLIIILMVFEIYSHFVNIVMNIIFSQIHSLNILILMKIYIFFRFLDYIIMNTIYEKPF
jgi:hypothetical protein